MENRLSILTIEDSEDDALLVKVALRNAGFLFDCERVQTSNELKAALFRRTWDIILSDYNLPQFNGLEALNIVREFDQDIPFILVSGAIGEETAVTVTKAGANDYVRKDQLHRLAAAVDRGFKEATVRRDRKQAYDMLIKSQVQLNSALKMAHLGHWEYDVRQDLFTFNDQFYSIFRTTADKVGGYTMNSKSYARHFVYPDDHRMVKNESVQAIKTTDPNFSRQFEHRMLYSDGSVGFLLIRFSIIKDDNRKTTKVYGVMQDITELLKAQESLRENEEKYRSLFNNSLDAILLTRPDGTILDANPAACRMFKCSEDEIQRLGRSGIVDLNDPRLSLALQQRQSTGKVTAEITMVRSDGQRFPADIASSVFMDASGKQKSSMIIRDMTERKNAEEVLKNRDILLKKLSANVPGMIYQCMRKPDGSYCVPFVTSAIWELFGCREEDVALDWSPLLAVISPEDRGRFLEGFEMSARTMNVRQSEYRVQIPGHQVRWLLGQSTPEKLTDGSIVWHGFATDITDRKRVEEELRKNESRLEGLLRITHYQAGSIQEFLDYALEEAIRLTDSQLGYIYHYDDVAQIFKLGAWSKTVMEECGLHDAKTMSTLASVGLWGEAVRQAKPIIVNDFSAPHASKKGYPEMHAPILKFLTIPIFSNGHIIAVAGVANKSLDYDSSDVRQLTLLMEAVWRITEENNSAKALHVSESKYRNMFNNAQEGIFQSTVDGKYLTANLAMAAMLGYASPEDLISSITDIPTQIYVLPDDRKRLLSRVEKYGFVKSFESQYKRKDGTTIWASVNLHPVFDDTSTLLHYEGFLEDITDRRASIELMRKALSATVLAIAASVEARDPYTAGHQSRVADLAFAIGMELGLSDYQTEGLRLASTIHDLGKLSVPSEILTKPKRLLEVEFNLIKIHCQAGYDILSKIEFPWPIARMVLEHHERMNGSGYPHGLKGEEILFESRILAVADVVESMASFRPYRPALGIDVALSEIEQNSGILYDPDVVRACSSIFRNKGYILVSV